MRADASGFKREAEGPITSAGRDLGKAFAAAFAIGGAAKTIEGIVHAATEHQAAFAVLDQTTRNAGAANDVYGQSIEALLEKEARLKGFSDEDLASAFQRLVSVTHDSKAALTDLGEAEDLSRFRHIDLAAAALAESKALQGSTSALQRYGIVVPQITTAEDNLKLAHQQALAAGAKFTEQQKEAYDQALKTAQAQDAQARTTSALALIQQRAGGAAETFANTASGQFDRVKQDFHQLEVAAGADFLGALAGASEGLGAFFTKAAESDRVRADFQQFADDVKGGLSDVKDVAETVGPPLLEVARDASELARAIGAPAILTGVAAYKVLSIVQKALASETGLYARAQAVLSGTKLADSSATGKQTAALVANTSALNAQAVAATRAAAAVSRDVATVAASTETAGVKAAGLAVQLEAIGPAAATGISAVQLEIAGLDDALTETQLRIDGLGAAFEQLPAAAAAGLGAASAEVAGVGAGSALTGAGQTGTLIAANEALAATYARLDAARAASIATEAEATAGINAETVALARLTEADTAAASAAVRLGLATQAAGVYFGETATAASIAAAAEERAAAAAAAAEGGGLLSGAGALGLAAIGGPIGLAIGSVAALAGGIAYLATRESNATRATHDLQDAVVGLAQASAQIPTDRLSVAEDKLAVKRDQNALATSKLSHSSLEYHQLLLNLASDSLNLESAQSALQAGLKKTGDEFEVERQKAQDLARQLVSDETKTQGPKGIQHVPLADVSGAQREAAAAAFAAGIQSSIQKAIDSGQRLTVVQQHNLELLEQYAAVYGKVPTQKQINLVLNNKDATLTLDNLVREIQGLPPLTAAAAAAAGQAVSDNFNAAVLAGANQFGLGDSINEAFALLPSQAGPSAAAAGSELGGIFSSAFAAAASLEATIQADVTAGQQARQAFLAATNPLRQSIASDKTDLEQLGQDRADAVTQGVQQLADAVQQAKTNLNTIGQDLAQSLRDFIEKPLNDEQARISAAQNRLSLLGDKTTLQNLRGEVLLPGGKSLSQDPTKAIAQLQALEKSTKSPALQNFIQQYQAAALQEKSDQLASKQAVAQAIEQRASTQLANLTDLFNQGKLSQQALERDVTAILRKQGLTPKTARERGAAFADTVAGQLTGLDRQASAVRSVPQAGSGLIPSIVRPLDTLEQTQKSIAGIAKQQRDKQLDETKKTNQLLQKIAGKDAANRALGSLDHNPGDKTKRGVDLVGTGG